MKIILLALAAWFFLSLLISLFLVRFAKFIRGRRRQKSDGPLSVAMKARMDRYLATANPDAPQKDVIPFPESRK